VCLPAGQPGAVNNIHAGTLINRNVKALRLRRVSYGRPCPANCLKKIFPDAEVIGSAVLRIDHRDESGGRMNAEPVLGF
jgi:hypothetical protein